MKKRMASPITGAPAIKGILVPLMQREEPKAVFARIDHASLSDPHEAATWLWMQEAPGVVLDWIEVTTKALMDIGGGEEPDDAAVDRYLPTAMAHWNRTIVPNAKTYAWAKTKLHGWLLRWPEREREAL